MEEWMDVNWKFFRIHKFNIFVGCVFGFVFAFSILSFVPKHWQATAIVQLPGLASEGPFVEMQRLGAPSLLNEVELRTKIPGLAKTMLAPVYGGKEHLTASLISGSQNALLLRYWNSNPDVALRGLQGVVDVLIEHENAPLAESVRNTAANLAEVEKRISNTKGALDSLKSDASSSDHIQGTLFYDTVISHDQDKIEAYKTAILNFDVAKARLIETVSVSTVPVFPTFLHKVALGCVLSLFLSLVLIYIRRTKVI